MYVSEYSGTSFQCRVKFSKQMTKDEKAFARELLNYKFDNNYTNKRYLKEYGICLSFDSGSKDSLSPAIRFTPGVYTLKDGLKFEKVEMKQGKQRLLSSVEEGAIKIKDCIYKAARKLKPEESNKFSTPWEYIKCLFKSKFS